jgi:hypothetical protein
MKTTIVMLTILLLSACVTLPSPTQEKEADYGEFPANYQDIARDYLMSELRDPSSIEIKNMSEPIKQWIGDKLTGIKYGYLVCVEVNSKNLLGNLTGLRSDALLIRDGAVIDYIKDGELISGMKLCD